MHPSPRRTVTLHELPAPLPTSSARPVLPERAQVVFVTNAVRRRGGLRARAAQQGDQQGDQQGRHRPVLAVVLRP